MKLLVQRFLKCVICICYRSDQDILTLLLVNETLKFETFKNVILPVVLRGWAN